MTRSNIELCNFIPGQSNIFSAGLLVLSIRNPPATYISPGYRYESPMNGISEREIV